MDNLILEGVVQRLREDLPGHPLLRVDRAGELEYLLRFASPRSDNLHVSLRPPHPYLHRAPAHRSVRVLPPDPFAGHLSRELEGAILRSLHRPGCDRVVEMVFETPSGETRILVAELIGKSANLLLLDAARSVRGYARRLASAFRAPGVGDPYRSPVPRPGYEGVTLEPHRAAEYVRRFASEGSPVTAAAVFLRGLSPPLGADFPCRVEAATDPVAALAEILGAVAAGRLEPTLYTPVPPEEMLRHPAEPGEFPVLSPFPLRSPPRPVPTPIPDVEEASRRYTALVEGQRRERELRERLAGTLQREVRRLRRLAEKLEVELAETAREEEHRRFGDLILAQLDKARTAGDFIVVPDLDNPAAPEIRVPADPSLSLKANAERHYARARKLRRGAGTIRRRLDSVREMLQASERWREPLERARNLADLQAVEKALPAARVAPGPGPLGPESAPIGGSGDPGLRKFKTADGFVILVGRTSRDNDRLTFHLAAPHDFWFHAADRSGAHVIVRNPSKLKELPKPVLLAAARIAAHYSRARGKGKTEVRYTLRKHVRKGKRFAPGLVVLRNHRSVEVEPGIPGGGNE